MLKKIGAVMALAVLLALASSTAANAAPSWSAPLHIGTGTYAVYSVSCPTTTFCMAAGEGGYVMKYDGSSWSSPANVDSSRSIYSVSCPTTTFCAAVGGFGYVLTYNGSTWSAPVQADNKDNWLNSVSCVSSSYCMAVGDRGYALTYNGSSWSLTANSVNSNAYLNSVSCATTTSCVSVGANGNAVSYASGVWSAPVNTNTSSSIGSVSCPTTTYCVAVNLHGYALTYNGSTWSAPVYTNNSDGGAVSCVSQLFCVTVDQSGYAATYNSRTWSTPMYINPLNQIGSLSCATVLFCMAGGAAGYVHQYTGIPVPGNIGPPTVAGGSVQGQILTEAHGTWSNSPNAYDYQWERCDVIGGGCVAIAGANSQNYVLAAVDVGHTLRVTEVAWNITGQSVPVTSTPTGVVVTPPPPPPPPKPVKCIVPKLKGKTLSKAKTLLAGAHCKLGKVTKPKNHKRHHKLVVIKQNPAAKTVLPSGSTVAIKLG